MYWSRYDASYLSRFAMAVRRVSESVDVWCVFDNTASGAALDNAWELQRLLFKESADVGNSSPRIDGPRRRPEQRVARATKETDERRA
jgi:uncharacterized protein YecE (DUF72 family)